MALNAYSTSYLFPILLMGNIAVFFAQQTDSPTNKFAIDLETRPRVEYRYNYTQPPNDTISPLLFATQRNRLSVSYSVKDLWEIKTELQEIHEWDKNIASHKVGSINFYQLFVEYRSDRFNIRMGRQGVLLDNGRLFSNAPWAQQGRAHEGVRITEHSKKHSQDLFFLFTRNYGNLFEPTYSPVASHKYKYLLVHHMDHNPIGHLSFNTINALEFFENPNFEKSLLRMTTGGRLEFNKKNLYTTLNAYFQFGKNPQGQKIEAYYLQPEIRLNISKYTLRLGAEIISGSPWRIPSDHSKSFDIRYGVAWKFMGNMNIFTQFPSDVGDKGLINPYLFLDLPLTNKIGLRTDFHLFYSQYPLMNEIHTSSRKFLGFENDISIKYHIATNIELNYGFSYLLPSPIMSSLPKIQNIDKNAIWNYLMLSYKIKMYNP